MASMDTYLHVPLPDEPPPGAKLWLGPSRWYTWMATTGWEPCDNPEAEPYWGDPANGWTPLKKGERVMVTGGEHFVNWLGTAQGEMMDGAEQVIVDGKDSPWSFSPRYLVRIPIPIPEKHECETQECASEQTPSERFVAPVGTPIKMGSGVIHWEGREIPFKEARLTAHMSDLTESPVEGTFSNMAQEPVPMPLSWTSIHSHGSVSGGSSPSDMAGIPDTDDEHHLAAGVYADSEQMNEVEKHQLVLVLPFRSAPNTNACRYIFGDEIQASRLGEWAALFVKKQIDYGDGADDLGLEGQYAELHRKITKLRRAMWEGHELVGEPLREVLMDLIGHCFLSMMYIDQPRHVRYPKGNKK